ncbi:polysaccharide pyruvyl transferase family protein [Celeribacter indicus]|uniref:Polysaccharide pyruvyl transferase domain-containing protein n=1 Tax=Celeribacter indicus TaxID=1208324 RepID=A0A0B5DW86_9RHOB|nr:polysaccharide pyruvyl transferase family protein [Celeribacter indicus]AJE45415.1 hypothetical protein P73_0700 [Celeribacter indicus]SDX01390.1 Polysaccharide pyruvyl transferase [Celeribacter indicus]
MPIAYPSRACRIRQKFGFQASRNLYWSCRDEMNFGDWAGPLLFEEMSGRQAIFCMPRRLVRGYVTFTVGSILHWITVPDRVDVWGSGIISADTRFERPRHTHAVRGPRTRARMLELGYDCPETYGDPALLLPLLFPVDGQKTCELGIVPHFVDFDIARTLFAGRSDVKLINVRASPVEVAREIASCRRIASSSLHGIIVAHAYGVPAMRLVFSERIKGDGVKFADYAEAFSATADLPMLAVPEGPPEALFFERMMDGGWLPQAGPLQEKLIESCPFARDDLRRSLLDRLAG